MKKTSILGAIAGDLIGSVYEFRPTKDYNFPLLDSNMEITDDSIMTVAVADWILHDSSLDSRNLADTMRKWGQRYRFPMGSYGDMFSKWLDNPGMKPYNSWGNGAAMRVSPVGFAFGTLEDTLEAARLTAEITHNHPEGIKGAQATAAAIYMTRNGMRKEVLRKELRNMFGYDMGRNCKSIRMQYHFESSCQKTVPESLTAYLESRNFEDALRLSISMGGDADTMGAITGAVAAARYGMPEKIFDFTTARIPADMLETVMEFEDKYTKTDNMYTPEHINSLEDNEIFVFGSNLKGLHGGGAARTAYERFGAVWGQGTGLQGQSYAIPTMHGGVDAIKPYVDEFISFAKAHPQLKFLVTKIGCGIAGFTEKEIAPLFKGAIGLDNVSLPKEFCEIICDTPGSALTKDRYRR